MVKTVYFDHRHVHMTSWHMSRDSVKMMSHMPKCVSHPEYQIRWGDFCHWNHQKSYRGKTPGGVVRGLIMHTGSNASDGSKNALIMHTGSNASDGSKKVPTSHRSFHWQTTSCKVIIVYPNFPFFCSPGRICSPLWTHYHNPQGRADARLERETFFKLLYKLACEYNRNSSVGGRIIEPNSPEKVFQYRSTVCTVASDALGIITMLELMRRKS